MRNFIQEGDTVTVTAPANVTSGQGVLVGALFGVAAAAASSGQPVNIVVEGVVELPKATGAIAEGARVFWDNTAGNVTTTATSNICIGNAVGLGGYLSGATTVRVKLAQPNATAA